MFVHTYNIIIDHGVGAPVHGREIVYILNATYKQILNILMTTVQLHGAAAYDFHIEMNNSTVNTDIILERAFQNIFH